MKLSLFTLCVFCSSWGIVALAQECPPGVPRAMCAQAPCSIRKCPKHPYMGEGDCRNSFCGGCFAVYEKNGNPVNCTLGDGALPKCRAEHECSSFRAKKTHECLSDSDCSDGQTCCSDCWGRRCIDFSPKCYTPSECDGVACAVRSEECSINADCATGESCCKDCCGVKICMKERPASFDALPKCDVGVSCDEVRCNALHDLLKQDECYTNSDCPGESTCCQSCCRKVCVQPKSKPDESLGHLNKPSECYLVSNPGTCSGTAVGRYFYSIFTNQCIRLSYSGCGGNANNFKTVEECQQTCMGVRGPSQLRATCSEPLIAGSCRKWRLRYHYNTTSAKCELFYFGGCGGNENNFVLKEECQESCGPHEGQLENSQYPKCYGYSSGCEGSNCVAQGHRCSRNSDCDDGFTCCTSCCGRRCMKTTNDNYSCPNWSVSNNGQCQHNCDADFQCASNSKCCNYINGCRRCLGFVTV